MNIVIRKFKLKQSRVSFCRENLEEKEKFSFVSFVLRNRVNRYYSITVHTTSSCVSSTKQLRCALNEFLEIIQRLFWWSEEIENDNKSDERLQSIAMTKDIKDTFHRIIIRRCFHF